ncbi:hypothetical protein FOXB_06037 [Fusarium oxysporum f. sp. conglutinans Fo5176]|uniref:Uncharacterized protein n=1 Tax=Fusarium oxysporum (strain Fo5176) TaxID=660025 RepID=F9FI08_FUSOF|nr:hypothetical protein FOXB_06037 [Fusarium oxysporum f. sp. conglutinans Fo5176]
MSYIPMEEDIRFRGLQLSWLYKDNYLLIAYIYKPEIG